MNNLLVWYIYLLTVSGAIAIVCPSIIFLVMFFLLYIDVRMGRYTPWSFWSLQHKVTPS